MEKAEIIENVKAAGVTLEENENDAQEQETEEKEETKEVKLTQVEDSQATMMTEFAKANYKRIISPNGKQIKINGFFYNITKVTEEIEDTFSELEQKLNSVNALKPKEVRAALYNFLTFATNITEQDLKNCDRGEIKNIALILGMMQKGFRHL